MITNPKFRIIKLFFAALLAVFCVLPASDEPFAAKSAESDNKISFDPKLQAEADALLALFDKMPPVSVYLTGETIRKSGTNTERSVAYTHCESHTNPAIYLKRDFYEKTNKKQITNILKHELTHAWLCRQKLMSGHDENFRRKFAEVGGFGN